MLLAVAVLPLGARAWLQSGWQWPCPMRALAGLPCAACGGTRALAALAQFDFTAALAFNPLLAAGLLSLPLWPALKRFVPARFVAPLLWSLVMLNWIYLLLFLPS